MNKMIGFVSISLYIWNLMCFQTDAQCKSGWSEINDTCYLPVADEVTYTTAVAACHQLRAYLVTISHAGENKFIQQLQASSAIDQAWMGLTKSTDTCDVACSRSGWQWTDGTPYDKDSFKNWLSSEPQKGDICGRMHMSLSWSGNDECTADKVEGVNGYLCKKAGPCDNGWSVGKGSCYLPVRSRVDYADAVADCERRAATLLSISNQFESHNLEALLQRSGIEEGWIGITKPLSNCDELECRRRAWTWADNKTTYIPGVYHNWLTGSAGESQMEPSLDDKCSRMHRTDGWIGMSCTTNDKYGYICEKEADICFSDPCKNGGSCHYKLDSFICTCRMGYSGTFCQRRPPACDSNPCQKGATCTDSASGFSCTCVEGYTGVNCDVDIDECASVTCHNNATCREGVGWYKCDCPGEFKGKHCDLANVFTHASFIINDIFKWEYLDFGCTVTKQLVNTLETALNQSLHEDLKDFQSVNVILLRNDKDRVGVDVIVVSSQAEFNPSQIKLSVAESFEGVSYSSKLRSYNEQYADASDVDVKDPYTADHPTPALYHVFTPISISIEEEFEIAYTDVQSEKSLSVEKALTKELKAKLQDKIEDFQFVRIVLFRRDTLHTVVDLYVVSLSAKETFYPDSTKEAVREAMEPVISDDSVQIQSDFKIGVFTVGTPQIGTVPANQLYAFTETSVILGEDFNMAFTDIKSNESVMLKYQIEDELNDVVGAFVEHFQFVYVTAISMHKTRIVVDLNHVVLTTEEGFNATLLPQQIAQAMHEATQDDKLGGYQVVSLALTSNEAQIGVLPPEKAYAFVRAELTLDADWKAWYGDKTNEATKQIIAAMETEMNKELSDVKMWAKISRLTQSGTSYLLTRREKRASDGKTVVIHITVAALTIVETFNSTEITDRLVLVIEAMTKDRYIGGFMVNTNVTKVFKYERALLGTLTKYGAQPGEREIPDHLNSEPTPPWMIGVIIGAATLCGVVLLMGAFMAVLQQRRNNAQDRMSNVTYMEDEQDHKYRAGKASSGEISD